MQLKSKSEGSGVPNRNGAKVGNRPEPTGQQLTHGNRSVGPAELLNQVLASSALVFELLGLRPAA